MGKCIECYSEFLHLQKSWHKHNNGRRSYGYGYGVYFISLKVIPSSLKMKMKVKAISSSSLFLAAAIKPADPTVLLQTSALLIFLYVITNFVVPEIVTKSLGFDKLDEKEKPSSSSTDTDTDTDNIVDSQKQGNTISGSNKQNFDSSSKPK